MCWLCIPESACTVSVLVQFTEGAMDGKGRNYFDRKVEDKRYESIKQV